MSIIYGPVPSWRLGRSLGIDLISTEGKTCSFDCVYCQLGRTRHRSTERRVFVEMERLEAEFVALPPLEADHVTFSGTGEPTLASNLGDALDLVRMASPLRGVSAAVLTNASLMWRPDVRGELARADVVVAKLDAPDEALFRTINRPVEGLAWTEVAEGIRAFRREFRGWLALQMMFVAANRDRADEMAALARGLHPDEVQLNTPLRPSPTAPLSKEAMAEIEVVFSGLPTVSVYKSIRPGVIPLDEDEMRRRRPDEGHA